MVHPGVQFGECRAIEVIRQRTVVFEGHIFSCEHLVPSTSTTGIFQDVDVLPPLAGSRLHNGTSCILHLSAAIIFRIVLVTEATSTTVVVPIDSIAFANSFVKVGPLCANILAYVAVCRISAAATFSHHRDGLAAATRTVAVIGAAFSTVDALRVGAVYREYRTDFSADVQQQGEQNQ